MCVLRSTDYDYDMQTSVRVLKSTQAYVLQSTDFLISGIQLSYLCSNGETRKHAQMCVLRSTDYDYDMQTEIKQACVC